MNEISGIEKHAVNRIDKPFKKKELNSICNNKKPFKKRGKQI